MIIQQIQPGDGEKFLALNLALDNETRFMMLEPDERNDSAEFQEQQIQAIVSSPNSTIFVVDDGEKMAGYIALFGGRFRRIRHSAHIVIGVLKEYRGCGLGTELMKSALEWAEDTNITRLELTVVEDNQAAISLYKKHGFKEEGRKINSLLIDGKYINEIYMARVGT